MPPDDEVTHDVLEERIKGLRNLILYAASGFILIIGILGTLGGLWANAINGKIDASNTPIAKNERSISENSREIRLLAAQVAANTATTIERTKRLERIENSIIEVGKKVDALNSRLFNQRYP